MRFLVNKKLSLREAEELIRHPNPTVAVDIETVSLTNRLPLGIAVAISRDTAFYFFDCFDEYAHLMIDNTPLVVIQNASFDVPILVGKGYTIRRFEDTKVIAYSAGILDNSLASLSGSLLMRECPSVTSQWKKKDQGNIAIDHIKMGQMSMIHACNTFALWEILPITPLYKEIDRPCIDLIIEMEKWGLLINQYQLTQVEQATVVRAAGLEAELKEELGDINLASNPQVATALQAKGIIGTRKTKAGKDSVSEESLKPLGNPVANKILKYRSIMKTLTTYVPAFRRVDPIGRLHTSFGYTDTGRWKSSEPNHQNITRDEKFVEGE